MSITTLRGDDGATDLLYGHRVGKDHARIEACGAVDELNAMLGVARTQVPADSHWVGDIDRVQADLVGLMGQLAVVPADRDRYLRDGFPAIGGDDTERLTRMAAETEQRFLRPFRDWARPGGMGRPAAAFLDLTRTVCRRAERRVAALQLKGGALEYPEVLKFLNRLSDLLWLWARELEEDGLGHTAPPAAVAGAGE